MAHVVLALENLKFESSLGYMVRPILKTNHPNKQEKKKKSFFHKAAGTWVWISEFRIYQLPKEWKPKKKQNQHKLLVVLDFNI